MGDALTHRWWLIADVAAKGLLGALLLHAALNPDLQQYAGKAMQGRVLVYPLAVLVVPAGWWLLGRRRPFPALADLLITLPFLIDAAGNALDLYDTIDVWDDANHFVNWMLLSAGFVLLLPERLERWVLAGLGIGFGAAAAIVWELAESVTFIPGSPEAATAYRDTLGDLVLGLVGAAIGSLLASRRIGTSSAPRADPD
jgi:hypothetical protein